jgi:hypothetical protein
MFFSQSIRTLILVGTLCCASANADTSSTPSFNPQGKFLFTVGVEQMNFDKEKSAENYIDDSGVALNLEGEYFIRPMFSAGFGLAFIPYDDNAGFKQQTKDGFGDIKTSSSEASGMLLFGDLGYKNYIGQDDRFYVTLRGGMSFMADSSRSIPNCSNCAEQDIELDGGLYTKLGTGVRLGNAWHLGLYYTGYLSGDLKNSMGLSVSYGLW